MSGYYQSQKQKASLQGMKKTSSLFEEVKSILKLCVMMNQENKSFHSGKINNYSFLGLSFHHDSFHIQF